MTRNRIVGLTGPNAAGKGEVARHLQRLGFAYHSLSDAVRDEATRRGLDHSRENLIQVGNELRARLGAGVLAERIAGRLMKEDGSLPSPAAIDSIRSPAEVVVLRRLEGFVLLGVDAPVAVRFERSRRRGRLGDGATLEEFTRREALENSADTSRQRLSETLSLADIVIQNDGTLEVLHARVLQALGLGGHDHR